MSNKMLIDASHVEETRVVVIRNNRIEEFDFESEHKKQLKGNIYLAKVTRVEPALQAAFIEYGGNRHGFLAFSEIHPDYYQIPAVDRLSILEEDITTVKIQNEIINKDNNNDNKSLLLSNSIDISSENNENLIEVIGNGDIIDEFHNNRLQMIDYKIQEVIKKRQILLVQILKEERGSKGAALTTYISLAGRYSVLMTNTVKGFGISRKITNLNDRKRLKDIIKEFDVPKGMGVILRTAGANRTKTEIKRDYDYLMRLWENIRILTLNSIAPALVHEEGSLIKRSIRDLYNKDIKEIIVSGEKGYREAKDFMKMLIPSYSKIVQPYRGKLPIFLQNDIESQLDCIIQPEVILKSGGYIVINQTEALVSIDVNSGRSIKKHSVEETAFQTNIEAAEEIARQLRLRDLSGLVVIDFIDMIEKRNIKYVEKKIKDCLRSDKARIKIGHISDFGLMEMSRQRLHTSVLESTTQPCKKCFGTGYVRSISSIALHVIRSIEKYLLHNNGHDIIVKTTTSTALYILNYKRKILASLEDNFCLSINIENDDTIGSKHLEINQGLPIKHLIYKKEKSISSNICKINNNKTQNIKNLLHGENENKKDSIKHLGLLLKITSIKKNISDNLEEKFITKIKEQKILKKGMKNTKSPVVISSQNNKNSKKIKRIGWWQRKDFSKNF